MDRIVWPRFNHVNSLNNTTSIPKLTHESDVLLVFCAVTGYQNDHITNKSAKGAAEYLTLAEVIR